MNDTSPRSEETSAHPDDTESSPAHITPPCCDTGMTASPETIPNPSAFASVFLKREFFYIIVVFLVVSAGFLRTWRVIETREPTSSVDPLFQSELEKRFETKLEMLEAANHPMALVGTGIELIGKTLFWSGLGIALLVLALWVSRGCILAPMASDAPPWGLWDVLKIAALFAGGGALFILLLRANDPRAFATSRFPAASILSGLLLISAAVVVVREERGGRLEDLGITKSAFLRGVILGLFAFVLLHPILHGLEIVHAEMAAKFPRSLPPPFLQRTAHELLVTPSLLAFMLAVFAVVVIAPVAEEILFRGLLLPALRRWMSPLAAVWLSGAFFGAAHASKENVFVLLPMLVMGVVLGYLYDRTRTLAAPLATHMTYNAFVVLHILAYRMVLTAQIS